jgi:dihydrofolate reductase
MSGRTTFHFVTDGINNALARAAEASEGKDIRLGGVVATIREYLHAGLVDEMHLAYAPVLLSSGECLLAGTDLLALGYELNAHISTANSMHVLIAKKNLV